MEEICAFTHPSIIKPLPCFWPFLGRCGTVSHTWKVCQSEGGVGIYLLWRKWKYWATILSLFSAKEALRIHKVSVHLFFFGSNIYNIWAQGLLEWRLPFPASLEAECGHITNFQPMGSKKQYMCKPCFEDGN